MFPVFPYTFKICIEWDKQSQKLFSWKYKDSYKKNITIWMHNRSLSLVLHNATCIAPFGTIGTMCWHNCFFYKNLMLGLCILHRTIDIISDWIKSLGNFPAVSWPTFMAYIRSKVNLLATEEHIQELARQLQLVGRVKKSLSF